MAKSSLTVGDLVARIEAPTVFHRVTEKFSGYVRVLPYRRSGREQILLPFRRGKSTVWAGDGSQWIVVGHD